MKRFYGKGLFSMMVAQAIVLGSAHAVSLTVTPDMTTTEYEGTLTLEIGDGLTDGETVIVEQIMDLNGNGIADPGDPLVASFRLTDGEASAIDGIVNTNVPRDWNPASTEITTVLAPGEFSVFAGSYIFKVSSPSGRFTPATAVLTVAGAGHSQSISGVVRHDGAALPYALVALLRIEGEDDELEAGAVADGSGSFSIGAPPGTYVVVAAADGYLMVEPVMVELEAGAGLTLDVEMYPAARVVSGRVVDAGDSTAGLPGVAVFFESDEQFVLDFTDSEGNFSVSVGPGDWEIFLSEEALARLGYVGTEGLWTVGAGSEDVTGLELAVPRATSLVYGYLRDPDENPLGGVEIFADSGDFVSIGFTDEEGYYVVAVIAGDWWIGPAHFDLEPMGLTAAGVNLSVSDREAVRVDFDALAFTAFLSGQVEDQDGNPVADHGIFAGEWSGGGWSFTRTDEEGNFSIGVFGGTWDLELESFEAADRGLVRPTLSFEVTDGVDITNIVYVARVATASIGGWVREADGTPVGPVDIFAFASIDGVSYNVWIEADDEGNFSFGVIDGTWTVGVAENDLADRGFAPVPNKTVAIANGDGTANFTIGEPPAPPRITSIHRLSGGGVGLTLAGQEGAMYRIEATVSLSDPVWVDLGAVFAGPGGLADFNDWDAWQFAKRFYHARQIEN